MDRDNGEHKLIVYMHNALNYLKLQKHLHEISNMLFVAKQLYYFDYTNRP